MDTNISINSNLSMDEAVELAKVMNDEVEAHLINDEVTAYVINDEVDAHIINDEIEAYSIEDDLKQVAAVFDDMDAAGETVDTPTVDPEQMKAFQNQMNNYMSAMANHTPGKEFEYESVTYVVQTNPHRGMWVRKEKRQAVNPNLNNKSVRRKLIKNPTKYIVSNL